MWGGNSSVSDGAETRCNSDGHRTGSVSYGDRRSRMSIVLKMSSVLSGIFFVGDVREGWEVKGRVHRIYYCYYFICIIQLKYNDDDINNTNYYINMSNTVQFLLHRNTYILLLSQVDKVLKPQICWL